MEAKIENFELRPNQIFLKDALKLSIEDVVKEQPKDKHTLSRADIIFIFSVYGSLDGFFNSIDYIWQNVKRQSTFTASHHIIS